jgi:two-component system, NarL family, response regulator LiaR
MFERTYQPQPIQPQPISRATTLPPSPGHTASTSPADHAEGHAALAPTRVMIVDDQPIVCNGVAFSLLAYPDLEVVAQAGTGEEALHACFDSDPLPDVVLMDLIMPGMGGVEAIRALHAELPQVQIIVLTSYQEGTLVEDALQAGAIGYLLKDVAIDELAKAIRLAARGMPILAPAAAQALVHNVARRPPPIGHDLTEREREVLDLLASGLSNQQIADRLVITPATVKFHTRSIRSKLGTSSRTETVVLALNNHLVHSNV